VTEGEGEWDVAGKRQMKFGYFIVEKK